MSREYAFVTDHPSFPNPFLVEISRRKCFSRRNLAYYEPNVTYCPKVITDVMKVLLEKKIVFRRYRVQLKKAMLDWIVSKNTRDISKASASDLVIRFIINFEVSHAFASIRVTRRHAHDIDAIKETIISLRQMRLCSEAHLNQSFSEDIDRTLGEIKFACNTIHTKKQCCKSKQKG